MYERELEVALASAALAGRYLVEEYERFQAVANASADITTHADRQAQEIILRHILQHFPEDALCAEEATATVQQAAQVGDRLWVVDPIDGTRGFAMKNGEFSVMIGFVCRGTIGAAVVGQPAVGRLTYAQLGGGCWRCDKDDAAPRRCQVTAVSQLGQATLTQSRSRQPAARSPWVAALSPGRVLESYSAGIKLALVARGEADLYLNTYDAFHDWDICAGHLLVTESGGQVTGTKGEELRYGLPGAWQRNGLLATNGKLHASAVAKLKGLNER
jgi:3'(2'), 5'-bisphosphate nucleotidase